MTVLTLVRRETDMVQVGTVAVAMTSQDKMIHESYVQGRPLDWILTAICNEMSAQIADMENMVADLEREEEEVLEKMGEAQRRARDAQKAADRLGWIPWYGAVLQKRCRTQREEVRRLKDAALKYRSKFKEKNKKLAQISITHEMLIMLGQREYCIPDPMPTRTRRFVKRFEESVQNNKLREHVNELAKDISEILGEWAAASLLYIQSMKHDKVLCDPEKGSMEPSLVYDKSKGKFIEISDGYVKPHAASNGLRRIYLPVPKSWEEKVVRAGGKIDDSTVNHVMSRVWVGFENYEKFEPYLPKSYRKIAPDFDFEVFPVFRFGNSSLIAKSQYDRVYKELAHDQGWRCILCGSYGGLIWDRLRDVRSQDMSAPLIIRPQWHFRRSDTNPEIGVAELHELLLICRDCDLAFETDRLDSLLADKEEYLKKKVFEHVERRRMMLLRCEESILTGKTNILAQHLRSLEDVKTWVVDLSRLPEISSVFEDGIMLSEHARSFAVAGLPVLSVDGDELHPKQSVHDLVEIMSRRINTHETRPNHAGYRLGNGLGNSKNSYQNQEPRLPGSSLEI